MNERIKELYRQAHSIRRYDGDPSREGNPPTVYWQGEVSAQRFAELIVQECLLALEPDLYESDIEYKVDQAFYKKCKRIIKKHFGVEE